VLFLSSLVISRKSWKKFVGDNLVAVDLHGLLQLHRIAIERTYEIPFRKTRGGIPVPDTKMDGQRDIDGDPPL
jgi:hypothetical protein